MYPTRKMHFFLLILTVFLVRTFFFYFSDFKSAKKMYPYEENAFFLLILTVFLVRVHFFYSFLLFFRFQKCKQSVPLQGKCTCFTNFDCFPRKGTPSLLFFTIFQISRVKKMYPYEENVFFLFFRFQKCKKNVPLRGKCIFFFTNFDCFPRKGTFFLLFFRFQMCKKSVPLRGKCIFLTNFDCFARKGTFFSHFFTIFQISKE